MFNTKCTIIKSPKKIKRSNYVCDKRFHVDYLLKLLTSDNYYGVILVSGKKSLFYKINKFETILLNKTNTSLQKKQKKGGQSAQRIGRIRDEKNDRYLQNLVSLSLRLFYDYETNSVNVKKLIIGGPAEWKNKLSSDKEIQRCLGPKIIKVISTREITNKTIEEVAEELPEYDLKIDRKYITEIKNLIRINPDKLIFGKQNIYNKLQDCLLKKIYIHISLKEDKDKINKLNTYGCTLEVIYSNELMLYDEIVGVTWY